MGLFNSSEDFFTTHFDEIQVRRNDLSDCYSQALIARETDLKIALLQKSLQKYISFKKWCYQSPGGKLFFQNKYEHLINVDGSIYSKDELIAADLRHQLYIKNEVIPVILEKAKIGIIQSQLYTEFPNITKIELKSLINELEYQKQVKKSKKGNSYLIEGC